MILIEDVPPGYKKHEWWPGFSGACGEDRIPAKTQHQIFGQKGNPTAANLFNTLACLQEFEGVRLQVVA